MKKSAANIVCFGEVLWDLLPTGKVAGGAPMNVAFHANQLGVTSHMISRIGNDDLGKDLLNLLTQKGVDTSLVQIDEIYATGSVKVTLDEKGSPSYEIISPVAWDFIDVNPTIISAVHNADAFVYGSLAARNETTRNTLLKLLESVKLKVFDVNLRSPFYNKSLIVQLLHKADIVKMNDEELVVIGEWLGINDTEANTAIKIKTHFNCQQLIVTRGAEGAWLLDEKEMITAEGVSIEVQDTIGSGDSFLAAYISKMLQGESLESCLQFAAATGAYVATQKGGTPDFTEAIIWELIKK